MAYNVNEVRIIGRLGADPEYRAFNNGNGVLNLRVATSEKWKDRSTGEQHERTEWHSVSVFNKWKIADGKKVLKKGSEVYVVGQLQTRKWQDQSGNDRYSTEIVVKGFDHELKAFMPVPRDDQQQAGNDGGQGGGYGATGYGDNGNQGNPTTPSGRTDNDLIDDEIPF